MSLIYNSACREAILNFFNTGTFRVLLTTSAYVQNKDTHTTRADVTNEVVGSGYTAKGLITAVTVAPVDTANDRVVVTFGAVTWLNVTLTARKAVYYKDFGGPATGDILVGVSDFGVDVVRSGTDLVMPLSTFTIQN